MIIYVYNYIYTKNIYILQCLLKSPTSSWRNVPRPEESTSEAQQLAAYSGWASRPWRFLSSRCSFRIRSILPGALRYADLCRLRQTACHEYHKHIITEVTPPGMMRDIFMLVFDQVIHEHHDHDNSLLSSLLSVLLVKQLLSSVP
jgi:hypothetical protein